jgi:hypothetical protein
MQIKPKKSILSPSYFKLTPQIIITAIHDDVEDAVIHSVSRREKITLTIKFSLNNPEISSKRTAYYGRIIDLRTGHLNTKSIDADAIGLTVRRNVIRTLNFIAKAFEEDEGLLNAGVFSELKLTFSLGKMSSITASKSKEFVNRHG